MSSRDPFGELAPRRSLPPGLKQRFPDRVLVMTTDRCFCACPHCTRKFILGKSPVVDSSARLAACVDYVKRHPKVRDVLLSGGDVLTLPDAKVAKFVEAFAKLDQIEVVRICTRAPVSNPARITAHLARLLRRVGRGKVWANVHVNTAEEARLARDAARALQMDPCYSSNKVIGMKQKASACSRMMRDATSMSRPRNFLNASSHAPSSRTTILPVSGW